MDEEPKFDGEVPEAAEAAEAVESENAAGETPSGSDELAWTEPSAPMTPERILDIALGVAVLTGEAIDRSARTLTERAKEFQQQAPEFIARAEERGRPLRENLLNIYSDETPTTERPVTQNGDSGGATEGAPPAGAAAESSESESEAAAASSPAAAFPSLGSGLAESLRSLGSSLGLIGGAATGTARQSADDEIRTLESRVRELEQVVASGKTGIAAEELAAAGAPPAAEGEETPADSATYVPGSGHPEDSLADSPYAVSETAEEQQSEAGASSAEADAATPSRGAGRRKVSSGDSETPAAQKGDASPPADGEAAA